MNKLLPVAVCVALISSFPALSAEEKIASPHSDQAITIPDSLDGYTLIMTSKEIKYVHISFYTRSLDNEAIVEKGEIGNYYEKYKERARSYGDPSPYPSPYYATVIFSKNKLTDEQGQSSEDYICEKIGKDILIIKSVWIKNGVNCGSGEPYLFLYFKTSNTGNAYFFMEESIEGNISFILKKSSEKK